MSEFNSKRKRVFKFTEWGTKSIAEQHLHRAKGRYLDTLMECPKTGEGVHTWILKVTTKAIHAKIKWSDAYKQILEAMNNCGRFEQPNEIYSAYQGALRHINSCVDTGSNMERPPKWNAHDPELAEKLIGEFEAEAKKIGVELYNKPESFQSDSACDGEMMMNLSKGYGGLKSILHTLYEGDPLLCCGEAMNRFTTKRLSEYHNMSGYQLIVPNPMTKPLGVKSSYANTPEDELPKEAYSAHTKDNTGERHYQVIEFDGFDLPYQARAGSYLRKFLPLAMVVFSGNKSLHFWFSVKGRKAEYVEDFFNLAHCLGADPVMWNTWQFARMPHVKRNDHKVRDVEQKVHFIAKPEDQRTCPLTEGIDFPMPILRQ